MTNDIEFAPYGIDENGEAYPPNKTQQRVLDWVDNVRAGKAKKSGIPVLCLRGGVGCIEENQLVLMANGEWKAIKQVSKGENVVTLKKGKYISAKVERRVDSGMKQCFEYKDSSRQRISCTPCHRFYTENTAFKYNTTTKGIKHKWSSVDSIQKDGDHSSHLKPVSIPLWDVKDYGITDEEIILIAYMITDGSYRSKGQSAKFINITKNYLEEFDRCFKKVFNIVPKWYKKGKGYDLLLTNGKIGQSSNRNKLGYVDICKYFKDRENIFHKFSLRQLGLFFNRVVSADGSVYMKSRESRDSAIMKIQISPGLDGEQGRNFILALKRFGINAHLYSRIRLENPNFDVHINGIDNLRRFFKYVGVIKGKETNSLKIINELERLDRKQTRYVQSEIGRLSAIKSKIDLGVQQVYDLTIEDSNNFIVNGFVVHNSGKTRGVMAPISEMLFEIPGLRVLWGRQDLKDLKLSVMDKFFGEVIPTEMICRKSEQYNWYDVRTGTGTEPSRIYFNGLKDLAGFGSQEFGVVVMTEAHETNEMAYRTLKRRLRQANVPVMMIIETEPPNESHWLMRLTDPSGEDYDPDIEVWELSTYENWDNLPEAYKQSLESMPKAWQRKYLYGKAGFIPDGRPFYEGFREEIHGGDFEYNENLPLMTGWDFGFHHPAFVVTQIDQMGRWYILAELMGSEITIDKFCDQVKTFCNVNFPNAKQWVHYGDPACLQHNDKSEKTSWDICKEKGYKLICHQSTYRQRQVIIDGKLSKMINGKPTMRVDSKCKIITDGLLGGYHYPELKPGQQNSPAHEQPYRDGFYEHLVNSLEYVAINIFKAVDRSRKVKYKHRKKPQNNAGFGF